MATKNILEIDRDLLDKEIKIKFGTNRELAKALNIAEDNLSQKLKRLAPKFIKELEKVGIVIHTILKLNEPNVPYGSILTTKQTQHYDQLLSLALDKIKQLEEENIQLQKINTALKLEETRLTDQLKHKIK